MAERILDEQAAAVNGKELLKAKRAGQTCITLFVVFLVSLLSFGKAPLARVVGTDGSRANLDLLSCLGIVAGVCALLFLLTRLPRVLRLSTARKVLGLIGCVGLIVHASLALFMPLSYGASLAQGVGTAGQQPLAASGPEEWVIDGKTYKISSTYYLRVGGELQYTIEYPYQFGLADTNMNDERALAIVVPLMKHAYAQGLYKRTSVTKLGQGEMTPSRIGVTLFEKGEGETKGYRVALTLDQIKNRIGQASARNSIPTSRPAAGTR